ncbi:MAG: Hypothetical protein BHV28_09610 [Candidatus Tokpelaia hoelldobleri]|uniref:Uncharacterized protein n=1 Tax=Candidatus Tokpelaia hoelldobleri TaxID=1902579 RepID=A0A1U9JUV4_9HYPH|nr:MAG: Hypothetical protein BHV28_09610 [Candidatus Tokpelaia hoelldoblerii]
MSYTPKYKATVVAFLNLCINKVLFDTRYCNKVGISKIVKLLPTGFVCLDKATFLALNAEQNGVQYNNFIVHTNFTISLKNLKIIQQYF